MQIYLKELVVQSLKFCTVGVLNTIVGFSIVFVLLKFSVDPVTSNLVGYLCGLICSFFFNKRWTFCSQGTAQKEILKFLIVFVIAYCSNLLVLTAILEMDLLNKYYAQIPAAVVYTMLGFLLNKFYVFNK